MKRVKRGMTIQEVRLIWQARSEIKTRAIMDSYYARRERSGGGYGHEGLGIYGTYQERAACEKVQLAVKLDSLVKTLGVFGFAVRRVLVVLG